jgi:hypothetical protein
LNAAPALAPRTEGGCIEIVDCLMRHCQSDQHAECVITELLETAVRLQNLVAELVAIATPHAPAG